MMIFFLGQKKSVYGSPTTFFAKMQRPNFFFGVLEKKHICTVTRLSLGNFCQNVESNLFFVVWRIKSQNKRASQQWRVRFPWLVNLEVSHFCLRVNSFSFNSILGAWFIFRDKFKNFHWLGQTILTHFLCESSDEYLNSFSVISFFSLSMYCFLKKIVGDYDMRYLCVRAI